MRWSGRDGHSEPFAQSKGPLCASCDGFSLHAAVVAAAAVACVSTRCAGASNTEGSDMALPSQIEHSVGSTHSFAAKRRQRNTGLIVAALVYRPRTSRDTPSVRLGRRLVAPACTIVAGNLLLVLSNSDVLGLLGLATDQVMKWAGRKLFRYLDVR